MRAYVQIIQGWVQNLLGSAAEQMVVRVSLAFGQHHALYRRRAGSMK
jgi:hypothetical protein